MFYTPFYSVFLIRIFKKTRPRILKEHRLLSTSGPMWWLGPDSNEGDTIKQRNGKARIVQEQIWRETMKIVYDILVLGL